MATPFKNLSALLSNRPDMSLRPSPERSALIQQLMAQSMQQSGAQTPIEGLNIASKPIIAALLARRERQGRENQSKQYQALAAALSRANQDGAEGEAAKRAALIIAGGQPGNPLAQSIIGAQAQQVFSPQSSRRPAVTEFGKINQDEREGNISPETADALRLAATGKDALAKRDAEAKLRSEFQTNVKGISSGLQALENARNLLSLEDNPVGAQAALTSFVRAIDDSVVRPSEQAMYQQIFGVAEGISNEIGRLLGEGAFGPESKKDISAAIEALAKSAESIRDNAITFYGRLATDSGLRPDNVTAFDFSPTRGAPNTPPPERDTSTDGEPVRTIL